MSGGHSQSQRRRVDPTGDSSSDAENPGILDERLLVLVFGSMNWDIHALCQTAAVNTKLRALAKRLLWRELCVYRAPRMIASLMNGAPNGRIGGGWHVMAKLLFYCCGAHSTRHFELGRPSPGHFAKETRFSKTSGRSFLVNKCRGDVLYVSDPCEHPSGDREDDLGIYRGVFGGFMKSRTRACLIRRQVGLEEKVKCPYCGARVWSMTAARLIPKSAARRLGSLDGGSEYFVCVNGHLHGACWLVPLSSDDGGDEEEDGGAGDGDEAEDTMDQNAGRKVNRLSEDTKFGANMAAEEDIVVSAAINLLSAFSFLLAFAVLRIQPVNDRVYFPKWYLKGIRASPRKSGPTVRKFVNLDLRTYVRFLNWMPAALHMPQPELIDHAGLDSAVYIRIYLLGLKIFVPIALLAFAVLVPVNWTGGSLQHIKDLTFNDIDKLSISNIPSGSPKLWAHIAMAYVVSFWTLYALYKEYEIVSRLRLQFLATEKRRPDQFTVLVRNVPPDNDETVSEHVDHFFCVNHPDHYLLHQVVYNANKLASLVEEKKNLQNWLTYYQTVYERNPNKKPKTKTGFWGLWGETVDAIDYYTSEITNLSEREAEEREKVLSDPNAIVPAAFVSFKTRWGAAVCAQTQQSNNPTIWLTEWAPEPRDVFWNSLSIPYVELNIRKLLMAAAFFFLTFFFMIPIAFVQSLASIEGIEKVFPFLTPVIEKDAVKAFIQGFLPGMVLKLFLANVPKILMAMSKVEGVTSLSSLERSSAAKYHLFILVNVFLGSIIAGAAFQQLDKFLNQPPTEIPKTIGVAIPIKATFFISYIMVDGWAGIAAEILRLSPLIMFHIKDAFLVKTDKDRQEAMDPGSIAFSISEPRIQLYFLLGLVYAVITPILLPFIIVFFAFAYLVFRHQIINVYDQKYESGAAFWPDIHRRIIIGLVISQVQLMGLMSTKNAAKSGPVILVLPVLTIWFHKFCKGRFESAFVKFPLQEAMIRDTLERATEPNLNLKTYLGDAYVHPVFKGGEQFEGLVAVDEEENDPLVATKRISRMNNNL